MKINHEKSKYDVSFCDWLHIKYINTKLFVIRQSRRMRVIFCKQDIGLYLLITLFWMMFGIAIYFWGQRCIATDNEPYTVANVAWDLSEGWFSSVILSFAIGAFVRIGEYKMKIRTQHQIYLSAMDDFERLTDIYIGQEAHEYHPLYCNRCLNDTISYIKSSGKRISVTKDNDITLIISIAMERLEKLLEDVKADRFISFDRPLTASDIDDVRWKFNQYVLDDDIPPDGICELLTLLKDILDRIRQPWRADILYKLDILKRLNKNPKNQILEDYYYKMLLQGHPFPKKVDATVRSERSAVVLKKLQQGKQHTTKE